MGVAVYYSVLGLDRRANDDEIRCAYHRLAEQYRSRSSQDQALATRRLLAIDEAYAILGDPVRRAGYDAQLAPRARHTPQLAGPDPAAFSVPVRVPAPAPPQPFLPLSGSEERPRHRLLRAATVAVMLIVVAIAVVAWQQDPKVATPTGSPPRHVAVPIGAEPPVAMPVPSRAPTQPATAAATLPSGHGRRPLLPRDIPARASSPSLARAVPIAAGDDSPDRTAQQPTRRYAAPTGAARHVRGDRE